MTPMDSDSESQDSDDGRRFRFEATRKDPVAPVDTSRTKSPKKPKHKSRCDESSSRHYRDRKERSKHESGRKSDDKDLRHLIRQSKHESWSSRQEDGAKTSHKDHRDTGSTANSRHPSGGGDAREKSRDSKRQTDRDRSGHRAQRSCERSYERNHDDRGSSDKHRIRCREMYKHRSRDRSRERSHQSNKVKFSSSDRFREDYGKHDSSRKISVKENRSQNSRDYTSPKNVERVRSHSETRSFVASSDASKKDSPPLDVQDCKDLDLSQFDVLSETYENMSDGADARSRTLSPCRKRKVKKHDSPRDQSESRDSKRPRKQRQELRKVKTRNDDDELASARSSNNPSAVSDSSLGPSATISVTRDTYADFARDKSERCKEESTMTVRRREERSASREKHVRHFGVFADEIRLSEKNTERSRTTYGPLLPPELVFGTFDGEEEHYPEISSSRLDSKHKVQKSTSIKDDDDNDNNDNDDKKSRLIGPRLPIIGEMGRSTEFRLMNHRSEELGGEEMEEGAWASKEMDGAFGPALPPHLLQHVRVNEPRDRIIGPVLPDIAVVAKPCENSNAESDDDCAIGPLPADHPALRSSRVHEQLDARARKIRNESYSEEVDATNKREEWMTELPPAQAISLGLGPRKFRIREGPDMSDRSCWTDTPAQKAQKRKDAEAKRLVNTEELDEKCARERHRKREGDKSSKREKSLLEIHQNKIAKKKRKEEKEAKLTGSSTRRPFDRDIDLQANRFDQAQKKAILFKAQMLDDRFSRGQI